MCRTYLRLVPVLLRAPLALMLFIIPARAQDDDDEHENRAGVTEVTVTAQRLDVARERVQPNLGAATYSLTNDTVESRPGGETQNLDKVLLQLPGVTEDGFGQLHIRGDRGDLEFRINNVILPEGLTDFGDTISTRIADKIELVTGTLPAQYGLRAAGVVNITTKSGTYLDGGQAELYGGTAGTLEPAVEYGGSAGNTDFFLTASYLASNQGVAAPDRNTHLLHDGTEQLQGLVYASHILDENNRLSIIVSASSQDIEIPNIHGLNAATVSGGAFLRPLLSDGISTYTSEQLKRSQRQDGHFAVLSLLHSDGPATIQLSGFVRYSSLTTHPDVTGDLLFDGVSLHLKRQALGTGLQADGVYEVDAKHTLRAGLVVSDGHWSSWRTASALPVDAMGRQTSDHPLSVSAKTVEHDAELSAYAQDSWKPIEPLAVNFGIRMDVVSGAAHFSPRINSVWTSSSGLTAHAGYARIVVATPQDDSAAQMTALAGTTGAFATTAHDPLRAETDDYYDIGVQQRFEDITLGVDGYWRHAHDLIYDGLFGASLVRTPFNFGSGLIRGIEFSATYAEGSLSAWGNLSVSRADGTRIVSNQFLFTPAQLSSSGYRSLDYDQTLTASAGLSYRWHTLQISGDLLIGSGFPRTQLGGVTNGGRLPSNARANISAVYHLWRESRYMLDLRIDIINVFDTRYQILDGSSLATHTAQWGAQRGFFAGLEQSF